MAITPKKEEAIETGLRSAVGNIINKLLTIPINIFVASTLGPLGFGILAIVHLILQYLSYLNLGMLANLKREIPIAYGKNDVEEVKTVYQTIFTNYSIITVVGLLFLQGLFLFGFNFNGELLGYHFFLIALIYLFTNLCSFYCSYVKAEGRFIIFGNYELITKVTSPFIILILVYFFTLNGMILSLLTIQIIGLIYILKTIKIPVIKYKIRIKKTLELMSTGLPMFLNKIIDGVFLSIATLLAANYLGSIELGILAFGLSISSVKKVPFATIFMLVIHRNMGIQGGLKGIKNYTEFKNYFGAPFYIYMILLTSIIGAMVIIYLFSIRLFLNEFLDAIPIFFILFFTLNFYNARHFMNSYLDITKQMFRRTLIVLVGVLINAWLCYLTIQQGLGIFGLALSVSITMILIAISIIIITLKQIYQNSYIALMFILKLLIISSLLTFLLFLFKDNNILLYDHSLSTIMDMAFALIDLILTIIIFISSTVFLYTILFYKHNLHGELLNIANYILSKLVYKRLQ